MFYNDLKESNKLSLVLGLNILDDDGVIQEVCSELKSIQSSFDINLIFKASWDKANRSSIHSYRGKGLNEGRRLFELIKIKFEYMDKNFKNFEKLVETRIDLAISKNNEKK